MPSPGGYDLECELERKPLVLKGVGDAPKPKGASLCFRCTHSFIYRRKANEFNVTIICRSIDQTMPHDIIECSGFGEQNRLDLSDMAQMARLIDDRKVSQGPYR